MQQWYNLSDPAMEDSLYENTSMRLFAGLSLVDATIIEAPSSTKNKTGERDPEMHQTKKGNQWHFGMKAHIGVGSRTGITHSFTTTAANEHDLNQADQILHGEESFTFADAGYRGLKKNDGKLTMLFALANSVRVDQVLRTQG